MLELINRDRAAVGVSPVRLDDVASQAGQKHSDEMAEHEYCSHVSLDGKKAPQRYTECGGVDYVAENVLARDVHPDWHGGVRPSQEQLFSKKELEQIETSFFNEKPPNDGHRKNIIDPRHTHVGIGLTAVLLTHRQGYEDDAVTCTQQFVNRYAEFSHLSGTLARGETLDVEGELSPGLSIQSLQILREELPAPKSVQQLRGEFSCGKGYTHPDENVDNLFPEHQGKSGSVEQTGRRFRLEVTPARSWKDGLYYLNLWVTAPDRAEPFIVSTIVRPLRR